MKITLPTFLVIVFFSLYQSNAQCIQTAFAFGNNINTPMYNITGGVEVLLNTKQKQVTLNLKDDFRTASGPDVRVYLVNPNLLSDIELAKTKISNLSSIPMGMVSSNTISPNGAKTFTVTIPDNIDITKYTKVFFYCEAFDVFWDFGTILGFNINTCASLSSPDFEFNNQLSLYPNPTHNQLHITAKSDAKIEVITVCNLQGQVVITSLDESFDVSHLPKGIYIVKVKTDKGETTTKIVKE